MNHNPLAGASYKLVVDGQTYQGKTDNNGMVTQPVGGNPTSGTLTLDMLSFDLTIQPLAAINTEEGYATRLNNLGYYSDVAANALMRFQSANDLDITGQMDDDTQAKLQEIHGH